VKEIVSLSVLNVTNQLQSLNVSDEDLGDVKVKIMAGLSFSGLIEIENSKDVGDYMLRTYKIKDFEFHKNGVLTAINECLQKYFQEKE